MRVCYHVGSFRVYNPLPYEGIFQGVEIFYMINVSQLVRVLVLAIEAFVKDATNLAFLDLLFYPASTLVKPSIKFYKRFNSLLSYVVEGDNTSLELKLSYVLLHKFYLEALLEARIRWR